MNLGHAGFSNGQDYADFFHGEFLKIVEAEHLAFFFVEFLDGFGKDGAYFRAQREVERIFLGACRGHSNFLLDEAVVGLTLKAAEIQAVKFAQEPLEFDEFNAETGSDLRLRRRASEFRGEFTVDLFDLPSLAAEVAGAPVQLTQAVENGAANAKARIGPKLDSLAGIEFVHRVNEPENSSVHQVVKKNMGRQPIVDAARSEAALWKIFDEEVLAFLGPLTQLAVRVWKRSSASDTSLPAVSVEWILTHRTTPRDCMETVAETSRGENLPSRKRVGVVRVDYQS